MKKAILLALLLIGTTTLFAQTVIEDDLGLHNPNLQAKRGTYDVLIDTTKGYHIVEMTPAVLRQIEAHRQETTYAYLDIAPSITVRIHPRRTDSTTTTTTELNDEK